MTGRRSHGRLSALNGVVHQGSTNSSIDALSPKLFNAWTDGSISSSTFGTLFFPMNSYRIWSSQDSVDTLSARFVSRFELLRGPAASITLMARAIVECLDMVATSVIASSRFL